ELALLTQAGRAVANPGENEARSAQRPRVRCRVEGATPPSGLTDQENLSQRHEHLVPSMKPAAKGRCVPGGYAQIAAPPLHDALEKGTMCRRVGVLQPNGCRDQGRAPH